MGNTVRQLSTNWTAFYKIALPMLWTGVVGVMALKPFFHQDTSSRAHTGDEWNILAIFIIGALYFWHLALRIKYVSLDGKDLVIAD